VTGGVLIGKLCRPPCPIVAVFRTHLRLLCKRTAVLFRATQLELPDRHAVSFDHYITASFGYLHLDLLLRNVSKDERLQAGRGHDALAVHHSPAAKDNWDQVM
jgi:hypothetical protein